MIASRSSEWVVTWLLGEVSETFNWLVEEVADEELGADAGGGVETFATSGFDRRLTGVLVMIGTVSCLGECEWTLNT